MKSAVAVFLIFALLPIWLPIAIVLIAFRIACELDHVLSRWLLLEEA